MSSPPQGISSLQGGRSREARSPAMLVIPGTSSVAHLEENIRSAEIQLTTPDLEELTTGSR